MMSGRPRVASPAWEIALGVWELVELHGERRRPHQAWFKAHRSKPSKTTTHGQHLMDENSGIVAIYTPFVPWGEDMMSLC